MALKPKIARTLQALLRNALFCLLVLALPAPAADLKSDGLAALKARDFPKAYNFLLQAVEDAKNQKDNRATADLLFYLGLSLQQFAASTDNQEKRAQLLGEAAAYYNQALGLAPKSRSKILNNLAQIYISQGATKLAQETLVNAIKLGDENQAFHLQNYGDVLVAAGDWKEACRFYALALWTEPDNAAILKKLVETCMQRDPPLLGLYLWDMTERGQILQAQNVAFSVLPDAKWRPDQKAELLAIVAVCLSKQTYDRREFPGTEAAAKLRELTEKEPTVAGGVGEIFQLHGREGYRREAYRWWRDKIDPFSSPPRGKWPLQAFQELIRSTGEYYKATGESALAENYFRLAIDLHEFAPDIPSLVSLADLYARANRQRDLQQLIYSKEETLFGGKARAYQELKLNEIYAFHRALGSIYSYLRKWGTTSEPTSAIFQLEHALSTWRQTQHNPDAKPVELEPELVDRLTTGYQETNQTAEIFPVRLKVAEELHSDGKSEAAAAVFAPIQRAEPPRELKRRYDLMKVDLQSRSDSASTEKLREKKSDVRVSVRSQSVDDRRQQSGLTPQEIADLQKALTEVLNKQHPEKNQTKTVNILSRQDVPKEVKEIELDGVNGMVVLEKNAKNFQVPFTIDSTSKAPAKRYIKP